MCEFTLSAQKGGSVLRNVPLNEHTTMRTGGKADFMIEVSSEETLAAAVRDAKNASLPYFILGNGSNVIADDNGYKGAVIHLGKNFSDIALIGGHIVECEAGAQLAAVCRFALENSLSGLEFAFGIPGTIGGALYMNAGAYGGEIKDCVQSCRCMGEDFTIFDMQAEAMELSYRHSVFMKKPYVITKVRLRLTKDDPAQIRAKMEEYTERRREKQPLEFPSAGSMFKRPEGYYAAALIEQSGMKGYSVGGAQVSAKHSGFVVNKGGATTEDIEKLVETVRKTVYEKTGIMLETEPVFLK